MLVRKKEERSKDQFEKSFVLGRRPPSLLHSPTLPSCHATIKNTPWYYGKITTADSDLPSGLLGLVLAHLYDV
jgi:hypothetical protein